MFIYIQFWDICLVSITSHVLIPRNIHYQPKENKTTRKKFTLKALFNPLVNAAPVRAYLEFIRGIEIDADNPKKFTVYTNQKYIVGEAAIGNIPIYPTYVYDKDGLMSDYALSDLTDPDKSAELSEDESILIITKLLDAYQYIKQNGITHRDIKPDNIIFVGQP